MKHIIATVLVLWNMVSAADLIINGQSNKTYDGGSYGKCVVENSNDITIRNCNFSTTANVVLIQDGCRGVAVENCDIDGQNETCQAVYVKGACSDVTISNNNIYNIADDGICITGVSDITISGNVIHHLIGKGTDGRIDGPCYNGHSDGIEINNVTDVEISGNLIYDVYSTSGMILVGWEGVNTRMSVYNNIIYTPDVGFNMYVGNQRNTTICNNTMWGAQNGAVAILSNNEGLTLKNNLLKSINFDHGGETYDASVHDFGYNLVALVGVSQDYIPLATDVWAPNPLLTDLSYAQSQKNYPIDPAGFTPLGASAAVNKGTTGAGIPATDFFGNARDTQPDLGAIECQDASALQDAIVHMERTAGAPRAYYTLDGRYLGGRELAGRLGTGVYLLRRANGEPEKTVIR